MKPRQIKSVLKSILKSENKFNQFLYDQSDINNDFDQSGIDEEKDISKSTFNSTIINFLSTDKSKKTETIHEIQDILLGSTQSLS